MILVRRVVVFIAVGLILATFSLFIKSSNTTTLGSSYSTMSNDSRGGLSICPSVVVDSTGYLRGWPFGVVEVSIYESPEDFTVATCQGASDDLYPVSYLVNAIIFAAVSVLIFLLIKELKKKGVKNG